MLRFMHTKRFNTFFKIWVQSRVGAIPCLPIIKLCVNLIHLAIGQKSLILSNKRDSTLEKQLRCIRISTFAEIPPLF